MHAERDRLRSNRQESAALGAASAAFKRGEYQVAYRTWLPLAKIGNAKAQHALGKLFEFGLGVEQDLAQAAHWYRKSAYQGVNDAQGALARMYAEGIGVSQNFAKATKWFRKAARAGDSTADATLGVMNRQRLGITHSGEAREYYRRSAQNDDPDAQFILGLTYALGEGIPQDHAEAGKWLREAARQGHSKAQHHLGLMYHSGKGVGRDYKQAYAWLCMAVANGEDDAKGRCEAIGNQLTPAEREEAVRLARAITRNSTPNKD